MFELTIQASEKKERSLFHQYNRLSVQKVQENRLAAVGAASAEKSGTCYSAHCETHLNKKITMEK